MVDARTRRADASSVDLLRSLLSVPGQRQNMIERALHSLADGIMFDLEDSVPPDLKRLARGIVAEAIARPSLATDPARFVRVNGTASDLLDEDVRAIVAPNLAAVVLPKVEDARELAHVDALLASLERERSLPADGIRLVVSVESARGLRNAGKLADACPRNLALLFGAEDFATDVRLPRGGTDPLRAYARSVLVVAAASADLFSIDLVSLEFKDPDAYRARARASREQGFTTAFCIHPMQLELANTVFAPSDEDVEYARRVVAALDRAVATGIGAIVVDGRFIERPIAERARRTIRLAEAIAARASAAASAAIRLVP